MSTAIIVARMEHGPAELRASASKSDDAATEPAFAGTCDSAGRGHGLRRRGKRGWIDRRCVTGCIAATRRASLFEVAQGRRGRRLNDQGADGGAARVGDRARSQDPSRWSAGAAWIYAQEVRRRFSVTVRRANHRQVAAQVEADPAAATPVASEEGSGGRRGI